MAPEEGQRWRRRTRRWTAVRSVVRPVDGAGAWAAWQATSGAYCTRGAFTGRGRRETSARGCTVNECTVNE